MKNQSKNQSPKISFNEKINEENAINSTSKNHEVRTLKKSTKSWKYYAVLVCVCVYMMWNVECSFGDLLPTRPTGGLRRHESRLITVAKKGYVKEARDLLNNESFVANLDEDDGVKALVFASLFGQEAIVDLLLQHPVVSLHPNDKSFNSALNYAREGHHFGIARKLEEAIEKRDENAKA